MTDDPTQSMPPLPWGDGPYSIKRHGTTLTTCDSEPVQTPGCIQAHGALLVARISDLTILQASENASQHLGESPEQLLGQPLARVVGAANEACLREMLEREPLAGSALYAFTLPARAGRVILFESWLRHEVPPNTVAAQRVSISFNFNWF
jgi:light-regulated signal transduction histidine kinase (bacteriophytochrome)